MPGLAPLSGPLAAGVDGVLPWESQAEQYPQQGPPGISYVAGHAPWGLVDCLLYRSEAGELVGILNHYPVPTPHGQRPGDVNMWVRPGWQRRGIGTRLAAEAVRRWSLDPNQQQYTAAGVAFATRFVEQDRAARG